MIAKTGEKWPARPGRHRGTLSPLSFLKVHRVLTLRPAAISLQTFSTLTYRFSSPCRSNCNSSSSYSVRMYSAGSLCLLTTVRVYAGESAVGKSR